MAKPGNNKGTSNFRSKLSEKDVIFIYTCNENDLSQTNLAKRFGVTQGTINHIRKGRTWSWLTSGLNEGKRNG